MTDRICTAKGCEFKVSYNDLGFCTGHYRRYERARNTYIERRKKEPQTMALRTIVDSVRESGALRQRNPERAPCEIEGCYLLSKAHDLCNKHYMAAVRAGDIVTKPRR